MAATPGNGLRMVVEDDAVLKDLDLTSPRIARELLSTMRGSVAPRVKAHLQTQHLSGGSLQVQTGTTRRAAFFRTDQDSRNVVTAIIGVDVAKAPGARILEFGGVITARSGRFLTIPLPAVRTGGGQPRFSARDVISNPGSFGYVGTFTRNRVIFGSLGGGGSEPLFVLKPRVTMKPVGYLLATLEEMTPWAQTQLQEAAFRGAEVKAGG